MLLTDVKPHDSDVLHLSISTKTYWRRQLLSNDGNLFVHLIIKSIQTKITIKKHEYHFNKIENNFFY